MGEIEGELQLKGRENGRRSFQIEEGVSQKPRKKRLEKERLLTAERKRHWA